MKCILIWSSVTLFLYTCPNSMMPDTTGKNCTEVHEGTFDQETMLMCSARLDQGHATTTGAGQSRTTTPVATTPWVQTSTSPSSELPHVMTTTPVPTVVTGVSYHTTSSSPPMNLRTTTSPTRIPRSTERPIASPSNSSSPVTSVEYIPADNALAIVGLSVASVSVLGSSLFAFFIWRKYKEIRETKMVRPMEDNSEIEMQEQLKINKTRMDQLHRFQKGSMTARKPPRASQVKNMTLDQWKELRNNLDPTPASIRKPIVKREMKPMRAPPPAPENSVKPKLNDQ